MTHKPFKDLTDAEKGALLLAHHEGRRIEYFDCLGEWDIASTPCWDGGYIFRIAPEPKTPDTINWDHVSDEINAIARDDISVAGMCYYVPPERSGNGWYGLRVISAKYFASYRRGTVDWKDSLVIRPGYGADQ